MYACMQSIKTASLNYEKRTDFDTGSNIHFVKIHLQYFCA